MENEAWDGSVNKNVNITKVVPHDDMVDKLFSSSCTTQTINPSTLGVTPHVVAQVMPPSLASRSSRFLSTPGGQKNSQVSTSANILEATMINTPSNCTSSDPTLASMLPHKTRSLCELYNIDTTYSFSIFSLFYQIDLIHYHLGNLLKKKHGLKP